MMTQSRNQTDRSQEALPVDRFKQTKLIIKLFDLWGLSNAEMLKLLGLSKNSQSKLYRLKKGESAINGDQDAQDRVGYLLNIHSALGLLFPLNPELKYGWIKLRNEKLNGNTPLEVMLAGHMLGLIQVNGLVNQLKGQ